MSLTRFARFVEATNGQHVPTATETQSVYLFGLVLKAAEADAGNPAEHAREVFRAHRTAKADRLKIQTATIRRNHRDAHLGHDLEQALIHRFAILRHRLGQRQIKQPATNTVCQRVFGQIRVYDGRTRTDQNGKIMWIDALRRPHVQRTKGTQALARQVTMHSAGGQDHRHRNLVVAAVLIRQNDVARTRPHRIFGL